MDGRHGEDHDPENHLIPLVLRVPLGQQNKVIVFGNDYSTPDGTCIRDYVHVLDLASAHLLTMNAMTEDTSEIFNIGTGQGHSVFEVIRAAEQVTGSIIPYEVVSRRLGDAPSLLADPAKAIKQIKWIPKYKRINEIVASAWRWHQTHPHGYHNNSSTEISV